MNQFIPSKQEWQQVIRYGIAIVVLLFIGNHASAIFFALLPFALGLGISLALEPIVRFLAVRGRMGRAWATFSSLLLLAAALGLLLTWGASVLVKEIADFTDALPGYLQTVEAFVGRYTERLVAVYGALPTEVSSFISDNMSRFGQAVEGLLTTIGRAALAVLTAVPGLVAAGFLILIATFFISKDLPSIKDRFWRLIPPADRPRVKRVLFDLGGTAIKYLRAQAILVAITTTLATLGLLIVGVPNWFTAGLLIGALDLLPVVGPTLAFLPWIAYLLIVGNTSLALSLLVVYAVSTGSRSLFEAKVIGDSVGLHPLATLIALYAGALLWGVAGALIGPILLLVAKAVYKAWRSVDAN